MLKYDKFWLPKICVISDHRQSSVKCLYIVYCIWTWFELYYNSNEYRTHLDDHHHNDDEGNQKQHKKNRLIKVRLNYDNFFPSLSLVLCVRRTGITYDWVYHFICLAMFIWFFFSSGHRRRCCRHRLRCVYVFAKSVC